MTDNQTPTGGNEVPKNTGDSGAGASGSGAAGAGGSSGAGGSGSAPPPGGSGTPPPPGGPSTPAAAGAGAAAAGGSGGTNGWLIAGIAVAVIAVIAIVVAMANSSDDVDAVAVGDTTTTTVAETTTTSAETTTTAAETTTTSAETTTTVAETTTTSAETTTTAAGGGEGECAVENLALVESGVLTVATGEPAFPPWVGTTDGEDFDTPEAGTGYEAALAYEVASRMGFSNDQVVWVRTGFDEAIAPGPKNFDFNLQQYSITPERAEAVDFSEPYYVTQQAFVAYADSDYSSVTTIDELKPANLGAQIGTTSLDFIDQVIQPDNPASVYDTNADAKAALDAGQIDGLVVDLPTAYFITAAEIEGTEVVGTFEAQADNPDEFGLLFAKDNTLRDCVDPVIVEMTDDGTIESLIGQWLNQGGDVPVITG